MSVSENYIKECLDIPVQDLLKTEIEKKKDVVPERAAMFMRGDIHNDDNPNKSLEVNPRKPLP